MNPEFTFHLLLTFLFGFVITGPSVLLMIMCQTIDQYKGFIPYKHQDPNFRLLWNFYSMTYGDAIGLTFIWGASIQAVILASAIPHNLGVLANLANPCCLAGAFATAVFRWVCLKPDHVPDWGNRGVGKLSPGGKVHSVFLGLTVCIGFLGPSCFWPYSGTIYFRHHEDLLIASWLIGSTIWLISIIADWRLGRFDPIQATAPQ